MKNKIFKFFKIVYCTIIFLPICLMAIYMAVKYEDYKDIDEMFEAGEQDPAYKWFIKVFKFWK